jgi:hypothetical protein
MRVQNNLIKALACAYETRDLELYQDLLDDQYVFEFVVDIADSLGLPPAAGTSRI